MYIRTIPALPSRRAKRMTCDEPAEHMLPHLSDPLRVRRARKSDACVTQGAHFAIWRASPIESMLNVRECDKKCSLYMDIQNNFIYQVKNIMAFMFEQNKKKSSKRFRHTVADCGRMITDNSRLDLR